MAGLDMFVPPGSDLESDLDGSDRCLPKVEIPKKVLKKPGRKKGGAKAKKSGGPLEERAAVDDAAVSDGQGSEADDEGDTDFTIAPKKPKARKKKVVKRQKQQKRSRREAGSSGESAHDENEDPLASAAPRTKKVSKTKGKSPKKKTLHRPNWKNYRDNIAEGAVDSDESDAETEAPLQDRLGKSGHSPSARRKKTGKKVSAEQEATAEFLEGGTPLVIHNVSKKRKSPSKSRARRSDEAENAAELPNPKKMKRSPLKKAPGKPIRPASSSDDEQSAVEPSAQKTARSKAPQMKKRMLKRDTLKKGKREGSRPLKATPGRTKPLTKNKSTSSTQKNKAAPQAAARPVTKGRKVNKKKVVNEEKPESSSVTNTGSDAESMAVTEDEDSADDGVTALQGSKMGKRTDLGFIAFAGGDDALAAVVHHAVTALGGYNILHDPNDIPDVFVVGSARRRTASVLKAISAGVWCVTMNWVIDSISRGRWLPLEEFEATDMYAGVRRARQARESGKTKLLKDVRIKAEGALKIPNATLGKIIGKAGGRIVSQRPHYIICGELQSDGGQMECEQESARLVSLNWLCDSIERWELLDPEDYQP